MPLVRNGDGTWVLKIDDHEQPKIDEFHPAYLEALPRYAAALEPAFSLARKKCEFEFLFSLLRIRGLQAAGWDPYETTLRAIPALKKVHDQILEFEAARHLQLWIYGHILEASEPYELLANLVDVANGGRFKMERFPPKKGGYPQSPGEKIAKIEKAAGEANISTVAVPLREIWNRNFRNSIFHADYILYGSDVRTVRPTHTYSHDEVMTLVNRAFAYHEVLAGLYKAHIESYKEPKEIDVHPKWRGYPEEHAVVIVREGYGVVGLKDAWEPNQIAAGKIPFRIGHFTQDEIDLLDSDHTVAKLPLRPGATASTTLLQRSRILKNIFNYLKKIFLAVKN
jgi:hypothetical protein